MNTTKGYIVWSKAVTDAASSCKDEDEAIQKLDMLLKEVYEGEFEYEGKRYPCIPKDRELTQVLSEYYDAMEEAGKIEDD